MSSDLNVEAALKELRKEEGNKRCFECGERGPSYIDMDHGTFVCTGCAGILREFTFKIKGISMATFTANEVKALKASGGNVGAKKVWMARFMEDDTPKPGDKEAIRQFIRTKYVLKKWIDKKKSKKAETSSSEEEEEESEDESVKQKAKKASSSTTAKAVPASSATTTGAKKPVAVQIKPTITAKPAVKQDAALLDMDFGGFSSAPSAPQTTVSKPIAASAATQDDDFGFDDFVSANPAPQPKLPAPSTASAADPFDFGDFSAAIPSQPAATVKADPFSGFQPAPAQSSQHSANANASIYPPQTQTYSMQPNQYPSSMFPQSPAYPQQQQQYPPQQQQYMQYPQQAHPQQQLYPPQQQYPQQQQHYPMMMTGFSNPAMTMMPQQTSQGGAFGSQTTFSMQPGQNGGSSSFVPQMAAQQPFLQQQQQFNPNNPFAAAKAANRPLNPPKEDIFGGFT